MWVEIEEIYDQIIMYLFEKRIISYVIYKKLKDVIYWDNFKKVKEYLITLKNGKWIGEMTCNLLTSILYSHYNGCDGSN